MKRRKCRTCPLIEPQDQPWIGDQCSLCVDREKRLGEKRKDRRGRNWPQWQKAGVAAASAKAREETVIEAGRCQSCGETKPLEQFPPRCANEPKWYAHHARCKECICEGVKAINRRRGLEKFIEELPRRTLVNLKSELWYATERIKAIRAELKRREADYVVTHPRKMGSK